MRIYDLTIILKSGEKAVSGDKFGEQMEKTVIAVGGKLGKMTEMGRKQMAYKINGQSEAEYTNWTLELPESGVLQLDKKLSVDKNVLRHLLVRSN
ncbi:30S ribosomal protein S6 [Candidatus Amesbacteria bacterium RIFCSPHIGHO2_01_FULL_47_34]|uniref:Small ribosomal subunit protein bS6 n=1 Tax=Candidatus Amesbacteria bacterium RIFCSPLOWO2_01_FULL_47_33 TaxID=1797258 RepID=A0A1F4Z558_9BACT|nr:MAG: 30S ribosomal protein S6 [Candidatus Amesbacteria bacterium RIFCSPHIGHO2_01_FULL_47_34]OGD01333.1 MAG: 30S ribosomal protein S6 [Candidatus Amesbacteria bacterium RIFCSPLOWO2_01_FULL_47_33]